MTDQSGHRGVGARIQAVRRNRGFRSAKELADAVPSENVTPATIENLEAGRRADISVSQLLNIAMTLHVPPVMLLAQVGAAEGSVDLPNLSSDFDGMTAASFDAWIAGINDGAYRERSEEGRADRARLQSFREYQSLQRERRRLAVARSLEEEDGTASSGRLSLVDAELREIAAYLASVGWHVGGGAP